MHTLNMHVSVKHIKYESVGKGSNPGISRVGKQKVRGWMQTETVIDKQRIRIEKPARSSRLVDYSEILVEIFIKMISLGLGVGGCKT